MSVRGRDPGLAESLGRLFHSHPVAFPAILVLASGGFLVWILRAPPGHGSIGIGILIGLSIICLIAGLVALPFGMVTALRRQLHPVVLRCPHCGVESRNAPEPFGVETLDHVDYARVICSNCGADFTVDKYAKLA